MPGNDEARAKLSKAELLRVCEEFQSERDAAKRDVLRLADERNLALFEVERWKQRFLRLYEGCAHEHGPRAAVFERECPICEAMSESQSVYDAALATPPAGA